MSIQSTGSGPTTPHADRPHIPGYGIPDTLEGTLPWRWAEERLTRAITYWVATTRPDGRPHATPPWAVWVDGVIAFEGGSQTRRARNLAVNPAAIVHIESGDDIVIVEGVAEEIRQPDRELEAKLLAEYAKYKATHGYEADPANWRDGGLWLVRPEKVLGWSKFPDDTTRWTFGEKGR